MSGNRFWVDKAEPHPSSTLMFETSQGERSVVFRAELLAVVTPGGMIEIGPWPANGSVYLNADDARGLAKRLNRMAERATFK
jgi:hypothetical protein